MGKIGSAIIKSLKNKSVGLILILIGIFIPTVLYPLAKPTREQFLYSALYASKGVKYNYRLSDLEVVLKKGREGVTYGKYGDKREKYCIGRISVPYK